MQIKSIDGILREVTAEDFAKAATAAGWIPKDGKHHEKHSFTVGGMTVHMTEAEMKMVADFWWEHYGKNNMLEYAKKMQHKAAKHIAAAFGYDEKPKNEDEVKAAIGHALEIGGPCLFSEVVFEAMEWANAYFSIQNIEAEK